MAQRRDNRPLILLILVVLVCIIIIIALAVANGNKGKCEDGWDTAAQTGNTGSGKYRFSAVASDNEVCSTIGTEMLAHGGSAVDAAVAATFCLCVVDPGNVGLGGGSFILIKDVGLRGRVSSVNGWFKSPRSATSWDKRLQGPHSIAIPGTLRALEQAWKDHGRLEWNGLLHPAIDLCEHGWNATKNMAVMAQQNLELVKADQGLRSAYLKEDGSPYQEGEWIKDPILCHTLKEIAKEGAETFYTGHISHEILQDLKDIGANITVDDFSGYKTETPEPLFAEIETGYFTLHTPPPPSSGAALALMVKIMDGYGYKTSELSSESDDDLTLFYHRYLAALGFGLALKRRAIGDFSNPTEDVQDLVWKATDHDFTESLRRLINDTLPNKPDAIETGSSDNISEDRGSGLTVYGPDGMAVALTSSLGSGFGSMKRGVRTGLVFNNGIADFSAPKASGSVNNLGPGRQTASAASPVIIENEDGEVTLLAAASASDTSLSATALISMMTMWSHLGLGEISEFHRVFMESGKPAALSSDKNMNQVMLNTLLNQNNANLRNVLKDDLGFVQSISATMCDDCEPAGCIPACVEAVSDPRSNGVPDGY